MELLVIWQCFASAAAWGMSERGNSGCGGFILGLLLEPIGLPIAVVTPKSNEQRRAEIRKQKLMRYEDRARVSQCWKRGADLPAVANYCPACGEARQRGQSVATE